jgi:hypothetical protein
VSSESASEPAFCSITSARYAAQAIVMHRTLREALPGARTDVLCMDARTHGALEAIALPGLVGVGIEELEESDPDLRATQADRSAVEYAHTSKAAFCAHLLARRDSGWVSYVDADSMFFADPTPVFEELAGSSIGILGHRFGPRFASREHWAGPYCSSWISFAADSRAREVAAWWRERCLEWCHHRVEGDRYGDQGYLRAWPRLFGGVHVIRHPGLGPAPWTENDGLEGDRGAVTIDGHPLIAFHYQSLRVHRPRRLTRGARPPGGPIPLTWGIYRGYRITEPERELVWEPYLRRLAGAIDELSAIDPGFLDLLGAPGPREAARGLAQHLWMRWWDLRSRVG